MRYVFIVNPKAGAKNIFHEVEATAKNYFADNAEPFQVIETTGKGDATKITRRECEKGDKVRIYGFGGDGTLLEIVRGAMNMSNAEVGIFPTGSGNDYIRTYGEKETFLDFNKQIAGKSIPVDMIDTLGGSAINLCSVGLDAKVAYEMAGLKNIPGVKGSLAYDLALVKCLMGKIGDLMEVKLSTPEGEKVYAGEYLFALAAAGKWYGGGYMGAPKAVTNDGLLDFILIKKPPLYKIPSLVGIYKKGGHLDSPKFRDYLTVHRGYKMELTSGNDIYCNRDGECEKIKHEVFSLSKGSLRFILPEGLEYGIKPIRTDRLIIRNWREEDFEDYLEFASDDQVMPAAGNQAVTDRDAELTKFLQNAVPNRLSFAIELREEKKVIGAIGLQPDFRRWRINSQSVGYELNRSYWGNGYMPEALKAVTTHAFEEVGLEALSVYHFTVNEKSQSVIEKCGFVKEGILRKGFRRYDGTVFDDVLYSMTREEYFSQKKC